MPAAKTTAAKPVRKKKAPPRRTVTVTSTTTYKMTQTEYDVLIDNALQELTNYRYSNKIPQTTKITVEGTK